MSQLPAAQVAKKPNQTKKENPRRIRRACGKARSWQPCPTERNSRAVSFSCQQEQNSQDNTSTRFPVSHSAFLLQKKTVGVWHVRLERMLVPPSVQTGVDVHFAAIKPGQLAAGCVGASSNADLQRLRLGFAASNRESCPKHRGEL